MTQRVVQNTLFLIQSTIITSTLVYLTIATKPSDVYRRVEEMESSIVDLISTNGTIARKVDMEVEDIRRVNKSTTDHLRKIKQQLDVNTGWIKSRTQDRWTKQDHVNWEQAKFGEVLELEE